MCFCSFKQINDDDDDDDDDTLGGGWSAPVMVFADADTKGQMELTLCDGTNDWRLNCPNNCATVDDSLRHFIASPANDRIAVWGDHKPIWTGAGRAGLKLLVTRFCRATLIPARCIVLSYVCPSVSYNPTLYRRPNMSRKQTSYDSAGL